MLTARKTMDVVAAFRDVGTYRGAAEICGVDPKTVKRKVLAHEAGQLDEQRAGRAPVAKNTDVARIWWLSGSSDEGEGHRQAAVVEARAAGYVGSARNFRRLVAEEKKAVAGQERPSASSGGVGAGRDAGDRLGQHPGHGDPGVLCGVGVVEDPVRPFARDETAATTFALLAECFETLGGVPAKVLADRMGCLKGGVVAGVVIPTPDYVRFATHYGFSPDFCHAGDPNRRGSSSIWSATPNAISPCRRRDR
jgi:hypothetical protein